MRVDRRPEGLRGLLLGLVVVLALLGSALSGSAGQAHADCRGVRASFRATCVRDDVATYLSDLATEGVRGSDQDHFNEGLQVCAGQPGPSTLVVGWRYGHGCAADALPIHRGDKHESPLISTLAISRAETTDHPHSSSRWTGPLTTYQLMSGRQIS